jgi:hypothetical protein
MGKRKTAAPVTTEAAVFFQAKTLLPLRNQPRKRSVGINRLVRFHIEQGGLREGFVAGLAGGAGHECAAQRAIRRTGHPLMGCTRGCYVVAHDGINHTRGLCCPLHINVVGRRRGVGFHGSHGPADFVRVFEQRVEHGINQGQRRERRRRCAGRVKFGGLRGSAVDGVKASVRLSGSTFSELASPSVTIDLVSARASFSLPSYRNVAATCRCSTCLRAGVAAVVTAFARCGRATA